MALTILIAMQKCHLLGKLKLRMVKMLPDQTMEIFLHGCSIPVSLACCKASASDNVPA